ncbi:MAG: TetR/AcrR family transcriptional regulator [Polyangiaceae bacterium]
MSEARENLLRSILAELDLRGLGDRSLRDLAAAAGTSHRMLIHHFGSREGMLVAVVEHIESEERAATEGRYAPVDIDPAEELRVTWGRLSDPSVAGRERLFFECYARGLTGEAPFTRLFPGAVERWVGALSATDVARGFPLDAARARSRCVLALLRGLLLDLLATGDREGTTAALEAFLTMAGAPPKKRAR